MHKKDWPIALMCRVLGVKRNCYYGYQERQTNKESELELELLERIKALSESSKHSYGNRRIKSGLNALGYPIGRYKTRRLMKEGDILVLSHKKYKATTNSTHKQPVFDNVLNREFYAREANRAYVSDITYISTQEGWLYLAVVIDLYSRKLVGWSMNSRMEASLVCDALKMAIWQRQPPSGLIVHSDRGAQYASKLYRDLLERHQYVGSMSRKGNCWDNSVAESFFGSLKQERVQWQCYKTRQEAKQDILNYITMFYNSTRMHSYLGYKSPNQFETHTAILEGAA